jgi:diacylglycerol O-acyltransferase
MSRSVQTCRLSATDAAFLYLERKEIPMHIASVCIFEGPLPFKKFVSIINSKLHLVPRYRQIPVATAWSLEFPTWEDDPHFDIRRHIHHVRLATPGGEAELQALASRILSGLLDRTKPLWDMHVVDGLNDGRGAIIWRVHHALADGVSGASLIKLMLDSTPKAYRHSFRQRYRPRRPSKVELTLSDEISRMVNNTVTNLLSFEAGVLDIAQRYMGDNKDEVLKGLIELLPEFAASIERLPFNKPCTGARKFCWTQFNMEEVRVIREAAGGTVNDVMLAVLTRALARYVKLHGESVVKRFVRIICPLSLRKSEEHHKQGNQISFLPVALPLDARGPIRMLQAVTERTAALKKSGAVTIAGLAERWFNTVPPILQALFWRNIPDVIMPVSLMNILCTNVVGSPTPLYAAGRRMLAAYPQVPTGYDLGVGCAVHSYDGKLFFGIISDTHAAPDVECFRDFLIESFQELYRAAVLKTVRSTGKTVSAAEANMEQPVELAQAGNPEPQEAPATTTAGLTSVEKASKEAA